MISILPINPTTFPSQVTAKKITMELLERWQEWSDRHFAGKYRDAAETLICGLILLICAVAIRLYSGLKRCLGEAFGYWLADAEQQFLVESSLWLAQIAFELLPIVCCDMFWRVLEQDEIAQQQILEHELSWACSATAD